MKAPAALALLLLLASGCSAPGAENGEDPAAPAYAFAAPTTPAQAPDGFGTEPSLLAASDGALYFTSVLGSAEARGDGLWRSDDEATWTYLGKADYPFGGGDSDIDELPGGSLLLAGQWRPAAVPANPAVGSPYVTGGESVWRSDDRGETWTPFPTAGYFPAADRQWVAVDGQTVYLLFNVAATGLEVGRSMDGGRTWLPPTLVPQSTSPVPNGPNGIAGDAVVDSEGRLFVPYGPGPGGGPTQRAFRSSDGAQTFDVLTVHSAPAEAVSGAIFATLALDSADNLYYAWSESDAAGGMAVLLSVSTDHGDTWSKAVRATPPGTTAVFPWVVAGSPGRVAVAAYSADLSALPDEAPEGTQWHPTVSFSMDALSGTPTFETVKATAAPNHVGPICTGGTGCTSGRTLGDFFEAALLADGRVALVYADDAGATRVNSVVLQSAGQRLLG